MSWTRPRSCCNISPRKITLAFFPSQRKFQLEARRQSSVVPDSGVPEQERTYGVLDLVRTPNLRRKTLIITFIW